MRASSRKGHTKACLVCISGTALVLPSSGSRVPTWAMVAIVGYETLLELGPGATIVSYPEHHNNSMNSQE